MNHTTCPHHHRWCPTYEPDRNICPYRYGGLRVMAPIHRGLTRAMAEAYETQAYADFSRVASAIMDLPGVNYEQMTYRGVTAEMYSRAAIAADHYRNVSGS